MPWPTRFRARRCRAGIERRDGGGERHRARLRHRIHDRRPFSRTPHRVARAGPHRADRDRREWGRDYLDLCGQAVLLIRADGDGELSFGALQARLDVDYGPDEIGFTWTGFDEMNEVAGAGSAELQDDGSLRIEFEDHLGDEAVLKAVRDPS